MKQACSYLNTNLQEKEQSKNSKMQVNCLDDTQTSNQLATSSSRMEKRFFYSFTTILFVHLIFCPFLHGQDIKIKLEECPELAKKLNFDVPEGKALFVFEGKENYNFASDNENIYQPQKVGSIYKLLISADSPSGGITVFNDDASSLKIHYGREMLLGDKSLPPINSKDIKYFKLSMNLGYENVTQKKRAEGFLDIATHGDKDNLIILFPKPKNLDLQISGDTTQITKAEDGSYRVYIKPEAKKLDIISKGFNKTTIELGDSVGTKNTFYFYVRGSEADEENYNSNINVGDFLLKSDPPGALIELKGNPSFNQQKNRTPFTFKGYKAGQEMVHLTLDRYEPNDVLIVIGGKRNNKSVPLEPKFAFLNAFVEPAMPTSKVLLDGKELIGIENGKNFEIPKGTHSVEITAKHYYSQTKQISLAAGQSAELKVKLKPKMGLFSTEHNFGLVGAEVFLDGKSIGKQPILNMPLQEGEYSVSFKKRDFVTENISYKVDIQENKNIILTGVKMISQIDLRIHTEPQNGAIVFIDGEKIGTSPFNVKLKVGSHDIIIQKENYIDLRQTIDVGSEQDELTFKLEPEYNIRLVSKPTNVSVNFDGSFEGITPLEITASSGTHKVIFSKYGFFKRTKTISTDDIPSTRNTVLRKSDFFGAGISNAGIDLHAGLENFILTADIGFDDDIAMLMGLRIPYPLDFILSVGYGIKDFSSYDSNNPSATEGFFAGSIILPIHISNKFGIYLKAEMTPGRDSGDYAFYGGIFF